MTDFSLADGFFNSSAFRDDRNFVEKTTRGQIVEPAQAWDPAFNRVIKDELMDDHLDLVSLNIQRGRDHGITGYNSYREACGIQTGGQYDRVDTFEQLTRGGFLGSSDVEKLRRLYEHCTLLYCTLHSLYTGTSTWTTSTCSWRGSWRRRTRTRSWVQSSSASSETSSSDSRRGTGGE